MLWLSLIALLPYTLTVTGQREISVTLYKADGEERRHRNEIQAEPQAITL